MMLLVAGLSQAEAVTTRHDVDEQLYLELAEDFPAVGWFSNKEQPYCTATLVSPTQVLTAAHCVDDDGDGELDWNVLNRGRFRLGPHALETPEVDLGLLELEIGPGWSEGGESRAHDLLLLTLDGEVSGVEPMPWAPTDLTGQRVLLVGYGVTSDGLVADWEEGTRRAGENIVDGIDDNPWSGTGAWLFDFDSPDEDQNMCADYYGLPSEAEPLPLEAGAAPGDSGGPLFVELDGVWTLAGITSGGGHPYAQSESEQFLYGGVSEYAVLMDPDNAAWLEERILVEEEPADSASDTGWRQVMPEPEESCGGCSALGASWGLYGMLALLALRRRP